MRSRYRRPTEGNRRKTIGAVAVAGVLVAAGLTGVQFANASTTPKAAKLVTVNGTQFDVSNCQKLEVDGADVLCDGEKIDPVQAQDAGAATLASAQALEASCDQFAADAGAAGDQAGDNQAGDQAGDNQAGDQAGDNQAGDQAGDEAAGQSPEAVKAAKAANKKVADKWTKAMNAADEKAGKKAGKDDKAGAKGKDDKAGKEDKAGKNGKAGENGNGDQGAADQGAAGNDAAAVAVTSAQASLLQACLALADAKAVVAAAGGDNADGSATAEPTDSATDEPADSATDQPADSATEPPADSATDEPTKSSAGKH